MQNNLYREEILEHYKDPQNFGKLKKFDGAAKQVNPFCGDEIEIFVLFSSRHPGKRGTSASRIFDSGQARMTVIEDIAFIGRGCAISIAAASMLTEFAKGKLVVTLTRFSEKDMLDLMQVEVSETRKKCALLALYTLKDCLNPKSEARNTKQ